MNTKIIVEGDKTMENAIKVAFATKDMEEINAHFGGAKALKGVNIMYSESIGGTAAAKVIRAGIHPMKANESTRIEDVLKSLVQMINSNPPPWIKNIMHMQTEHDVRQDRWAEGE